MTPGHPIRAHIETWLTGLAFVILPRLPRRCIVGLSRLFGRATYLLRPRLRRNGKANLDVAFGADKTPAEKKAILLRSFQSIALVLLDTFWFSRRTAERIRRHVTFDPCFDPLFTDKSQVCVTAHYGNWEVMGMAVTARGYRLHSVAKPLKNARVDQRFIEARRKTGQEIVRREGAVRSLLRILQRGEKIALVLDQNTRISEGGRFYPFFGLPVLVSTAPAALALKTSSALFIGMMSPQPDGNYRGDFGLEIPIAPYLEMPHGEAVDALTGRITLELESILRKQPGHWLWAYKRWKFIPADHDGTNYPAYARRVR